MNFVSTVLLALAMATDAFAAAVGRGAELRQPRWTEALRTGLIFGTIEATTPVIGWALGSAASGYVTAWASWIAFGLLVVLGAKMVIDGLRHSKVHESAKPTSHPFWLLALTGCATSIDAMAVGASLALLHIKIIPIAIAIGITTFTAVSVGVMLGRILGAVTGRRAQVGGGAALIVIGAVVLYQYLAALR